MFDETSRYASSARFEPSATDDVRFRGVLPRRPAPAPGIIEHRIGEADRLDRLAGYYYNDERRWWRLADANRETLFTTDLLASVGTASLLVPAGEAER